MDLPTLSAERVGWLTRKGDKMKTYRDTSTGEMVTVIERLNHCGVKVRTKDGKEYVTCFCGLLA